MAKTCFLTGYFEVAVLLEAIPPREGILQRQKTRIFSYKHVFFFKTDAL